eukprot:COSAG04_NODE_4968_length_1800_cov_3.416226_1_plen_76_part_00
MPGVTSIPTGRACNLRAQPLRAARITGARSTQRLSEMLHPLLGTVAKLPALVCVLSAETSRIRVSSKAATSGTRH